MTAELPPPRLLVVEDDLALAHALMRYLTRYEMTFVDTGADALEAVASRAFDLVLLDVNLPDASGIHVLRELRRLGHKAPILLMSGSYHTEANAEGMVVGADDYIAKPFVQKAIENKIERLLASYAARELAARESAELATLRARRELEAMTARGVLDCMLSRGQFDPALIRYEVVSNDQFAGDAVFARRVPDGRFRWMLNDVTGHTLASALVTIPLSVMFYGAPNGGNSMEEILAAMDRELAAMLPVYMFSAAAMCELDPAAGRLWVWNGGMPDVVVRRRSGAIVRVPSSDPPLGVRAPHDLKPCELGVEPGDRIYAFSDGLVEARDPDGAMLGIEAILSTLTADPISDTYERVRQRWRDHVADLPAGDDVSFVELVVPSR